jgi:hypothetical protein
MVCITLFISAKGGNKMKLGWAFAVAVAILFCLKVLEFVLKNYF